MTSTNTEMHEAIDALLAANDELVHAKTSADVARDRETICINAVNEAQKKLDTLLAAMRKEAPRHTDWGNEIRLTVR